MASPINANIVHESEAQRQHVRIRIPGQVEFSDSVISRNHPIYDISAGGFSFELEDHRYEVGQIFGGKLQIVCDGLGFAVPVCFRILRVDHKLRRAACAFQDLGETEVSALRRIISSYVAGELVTAGDMLTTISRDNGARARLAPTAPGLTAQGRVRAVSGTLIALLIGLLAFFYTASRLYDIAFVSHATAAKVAAPTYTVVMPRDATFFALVKDGDTVSKGQPLGTFETALLDVVDNVPGSFKLTPEQLSQLIGQRLKGSLASPCDCTVQRMLATDQQYVLRNQPVLALVPRGAQPYLLARFHYDQLPRLEQGRKVKFTVARSERAQDGVISELRVLPAQTIESNGLNDLNGLNTNAAITDVIAVIKPDGRIGLDHLDQPADVRLDPLFDRFR